MLIAMIVRNEMEDFHAENLSDEQMKELNPIIRQAIFNAVNLLAVLENPQSNKEQLDQALSITDFEMSLIPDYWEVPEHVSGDFVTATQNPIEMRRRDQSWIKDPEVLKLHSALLELGDITLDTPRDILAKHFTKSEIDTIFASEHPLWEFNDTQEKKIIATIAKLREHKVTQAQIMEARGKLSRTDIKGYYQASYMLDS